MSIHTITPFTTHPMSAVRDHSIHLFSWSGLVLLSLLVTFSGPGHAAPYFVGLAIENDMDDNGNITVINGSKVKVAYEVEDPDKLLHKNDRIQLLRVADDTVVASVKRGKKKSGTVSLLVKKSVDEALYVRYIPRGADPEPVRIISHPADPDHIPLLSISKASASDLTIGLNALRSAPPPYQAAHYSEMFITSQAPTASECATWNKFRASLVPEHYTCVQIHGSAGKGLTSCDSTAVTELATALRDGTARNVTVDGENWNVLPSIGIYFSASASAGGCNARAVRPCINNLNWGGISGGSCSQTSQTLGVSFH